MGKTLTLDDAVAGRRVVKGPRCTASALLDTLDPATAEAFARHLAGDTPASTLSGAMRDLGHRVGPDCIQRHRRGACACADR